MKPAAQTTLHFIDNEGILFHEPSQKLHHLNTTATFVWCLLEENKSDEQILTELQETFDLEKATAEDYLKQAEALFETLEVLEGFEPPNLPENNSQYKLPNISYRTPEISTYSEYQLLSTLFQAGFSCDQFKEIVDPILGHLKPGHQASNTKLIEIYQDADQIVLACDKTPMLSCDNILQLGPKAKALIWTLAVREHDFFLDIHAGVVGNGQKAILFPAAPGSGKSTLASALINQGYEYFSDEVALLDENFLVEPVPLATCVKDTGTEITETYIPHLQTFALHHRGDGKKVRYIPPIRDSVPAPTTKRPVGAIIFPRYKPEESQTSLTRLSNFEAIDELLKECVIINTHLDTKKIEQLINWIQQTPCYRLTTVNLQDAVEKIRSIKL